MQVIEEKNIFIPQRCYGIASSKQGYVSLITEDVYTCTAVVGHNKQQELSFLYHLDFNPSKKIIFTMFKELRDLYSVEECSKFDISFFGGDVVVRNTSLIKYFVRSTLKECQKLYGFKMVIAKDEWPKYFKEYETIRVDVKSGDISPSVQANKYGGPPPFSSMFSPIRRVYPENISDLKSCKKDRL